MVRPRQQSQQQQQSVRQAQQKQQKQQKQQGRYPLAQEQPKENLDGEAHCQQEPNQRRQQQQHQELREPRPCRGAPRVQVEYLGGKRSRGLVASEPIEASEVIYTEKAPLLVVQHEFSRLCGLTCSNCMSFVGSLKDCIRHVLTQAGRRECAADLVLLPDSFIHKAHARRETFHRMVCVEATERNAWLSFLSHARRHHDGLMMAGICMAQVVFEVLFEGRKFSEAVHPFRQFYSAPWESLAPDRVAPGGPADSLGSSRTETAEGRRSLLLESLALLKRVLDPIISSSKDPAVKEALDTLLQFDSFSRLLGTFSLVCLDVEFPHPLNRRLLDLQRNLSLFSRCHRGFPEASSGVPVEVASPSEDITAEDVQQLPLLRKLLEEVHAITRWDDGDEDPEVTGTPEAPAVTLRAPLLPFIGWGLFRLGSMTNHSCWPNAEADFPLDSAALEVRALRPIGRGEEVTVSYIDEALSLHQRRQTLQEVGFEGSSA
ncbi:hypothetical protein, conserved [Eimeria acervulina]|uniref:SET domain-containing protein n=1 Tax=Eimeria acervulina TaxID=5801 RepID=U6GW36_EIMAC|nr:hypothetical protein, conserved [Eimeria acervulina]CDI83488.1 hypothetical protein, conserved [Eimeria acervulina]